MNYKEKIMFISKKESDIKNLSNQLKEICNVEYLTRKYLDNYLLIANNETEYYFGVIIGNIIATGMHYDIKWVDTNKNLQELNNVCICKCYFNEEISNNDLLSGVMKRFSKRLSNAIYCIPVISKIASNNMCFEVYANFTNVFINKLDDTCFNEIVYCSSKTLRDIKNFADSYVLPKRIKEKGISIDYIECFDFVGNVVLTNLQNKEKENKKLYEYYDNSSYITGLYHPEGLNIAPKPQDSNVITGTNLERDYYISNYSYNLAEINPAKLEKCGVGIVITAKYSTYYEEQYMLTDAARKNYELIVACNIYDDDSRDITNAYRKLTEIPQNFEMIDISSVTSNVKTLSDTLLVVETNVTVERKVNEKMYNDKNTVYDSLYKYAQHKNSEFSFTIVDYYEVIDMNILLHYTNSSKFYETFEIPIGFRFEDGLVHLRKNIYDDTESEWINYTDISEVKAFFIH